MHNKLTTTVCNGLTDGINLREVCSELGARRENEMRQPIKRQP